MKVIVASEKVVAKFYVLKGSIGLLRCLNEPYIIGCVTKQRYHSLESKG